jgi:hypothetical protein
LGAHPFIFFLEMPSELLRGWIYFLSFVQWYKERKNSLLNFFLPFQSALHFFICFHLKIFGPIEFSVWKFRIGTYRSLAWSPPPLFLSSPRWNFRSQFYNHRNVYHYYYKPSSKILLLGSVSRVELNFNSRSGLRLNCSFKRADCTSPWW